MFRKVLLLKSTDYFSSTPDELLAKIAPVLRELRVESGATILEQGKPNSNLYVVCEGAVDVLHNEVEVTKLGKGQVFGEMSILDPHAVASAKVVASKATHFLSIDRDTFLKLIKDSPEIALNMLRVLSRRLQETNTKLAGLTQ